MKVDGRPLVDRPYLPKDHSPQQAWVATQRYNRELGTVVSGHVISPSNVSGRCDIWLQMSASGSKAALTNPTNVRQRPGHIDSTTRIDQHQCGILLDIFTKVDVDEGI